MNTIKQHTYLFLLALASLSSLPGCSADDLPGSSPEGANSTPASSFQIHVTDGGYASADAKPGTRAEENGYKTVFTADDKIGLFAVKGDQIVNEVNNLCLTASNEKGSIVWKDKEGKAPIMISGATYYAYYPYRSSLTGDLPPSVTDAAGFFTNVITNWSIATDQGTYANYTAQDLMIAQGTVNGKELSFSMQHQMALVVIDLPRTEYKLTTDLNYTWLTDAPDLHFTNFSPCRMSDGTYRYLVRPSASSSLSGSYTNTISKTWQFNPSVSASKYKIYKVDGGSDTKIEENYTLQVGDFYMKDGSLVSKDVSLSNEQKAACIGIVFWVGKEAFEKDLLLKQEHPDCSHGLVVALQDAILLNGSTTMNWSKGYESVQISTDNVYKSDFNIQNIDIMCGYSNTLALKAYNTKKGDSNGLRVLPCDAIEQYSKDNPAPANSSGWYFPSVMELKYVCWGQGQGEGITGRDNLNSYINKVGGTSFGGGYYWSSTEHSNYSRNARYVGFDNGYVGNSYKYGNAFLVRPLLAF